MKRGSDVSDERVVDVEELRIHWHEFASRHGQKFEVGYLDEGDALAHDERKTPFGIGVSWPVGDSRWKATTSVVKQRAAITRYALYQTSGQYQYILYFTNTEHYNYYFYDETGDYYQCNTFRNGDHWVRYNSNMPDIVYITGS